MSVPTQTNDFRALQNIIETLRGEKGCPWDRKQTSESISKYLKEETGELLEAIDSKKTDSIQEELGDLFFILSMLLAIHQEKGAFTPEDVFEQICQKMIGRHPHVFAGEKFSSEEELKKRWKSIKASEKISQNMTLKTD